MKKIKITDREQVKLLMDDFKNSKEKHGTALALDLNSSEALKVFQECMNNTGKVVVYRDGLYILPSIRVMDGKELKAEYKKINTLLNKYLDDYNKEQDPILKKWIEILIERSNKIGKRCIQLADEGYLRRGLAFDPVFESSESGPWTKSGAHGASSYEEQTSWIYQRRNDAIDLLKDYNENVKGIQKKLKETNLEKGIKIIVPKEKSLKEVHGYRDKQIENVSKSNDITLQIKSKRPMSPVSLPVEEQKQQAAALAQAVKARKVAPEEKKRAENPVQRPKIPPRIDNKTKIEAVSAARVAAAKEQSQRQPQKLQHSQQPGQQKQQNAAPKPQAAVVPDSTKIVKKEVKNDAVVRTPSEESKEKRKPSVTTQGAVVQGTRSAEMSRRVKDLRKMFEPDEIQTKPKTAGPSILTEQKIQNDRSKLPKSHTTSSNSQKPKPNN